jgi:hypothetical protein
MSEQANIEVTNELHGNVKVAIEYRGRTMVAVWKMTEAEARDEAEEIAARWKRAA